MAVTASGLRCSTGSVLGQRESVVPSREREVTSATVKATEIKTATRIDIQALRDSLCWSLQCITENRSGESDYLDVIFSSLVPAI